MDTIRIEILEKDYLSIPEDVRDRIVIRIIEPKEYDYSDNEEWAKLKKEVNKIYGDLKKLEFKIRHGK